MVGQECPTSAMEALRLSRVSDSPDSEAYSKYERDEQNGGLDRQIKVQPEGRMRHDEDHNRKRTSDRKESKDHAISDVSDDAFHGLVSRAFGDLSAMRSAYSTSMYLGMSRPLKPQALAEE